MQVVVKRKRNDPQGSLHRCCMLSSARVVRCWFKYPNERNPRCQLQVSGETAGRRPEEGGDDVKSAWPLYLGLHTRYNGSQQWVAKPRGGANPIKRPSVQIAGCNPPA